VGVTPPRGATADDDVEMEGLVMYKHVFSVMFFATILATGCAGDDESGGDLEFRTTFGCTQCGIGGSNAANANNFAVDQLHLHGDLNQDGIQVVGIRDPGDVMYRLRTEGDELVAASPANPVVATGAALIGWDIVLYSANTAEFIDLRIFGYDPTIASEATGAAPISGYALAWENPLAPNEWLSVCPNLLNGPEEVAVTIISGELYDGETKEVAPALDWITIACFDNAVAKVKLFNYGPNQDFDGMGNPASVEQRQATFKMITADYCGAGTSFTSDGTPLFWENQSLSVETGLHPFADVEALWGPEGALCLSTPRLALMEEVAVYCELPACEEIELTGNNHEWVTWINP
jgi:hypothetical protein